ncbi:sugar nucleotide-binding protein [Halobacteriovorax sp. RZ-1]|uniref:sugar nucleotide-binding protein n=1 Tax=unclassified Halobacteriovorax TaxID=2639665 RepID=UPI003710D967
MRILILGSSGLLGTNLNKELTKNFTVFNHTNTKESPYQANLVDYISASKLINSIKPNYIINLTAITDVNKCQKDSDLAYRVHCKIPANITKAIANLNEEIKVIHISTDQVYDKNYSREDEVILRNTYALTKYFGEKEFELDKTIVLRTNFFGGDTETRTSFTGWINNISNNEEFNGFQNIYFNPLHISTLVEVIQKITTNFKPGIYNLGSHDGLSKYEFIVNYLERIGKNTDICKPSMYTDTGYPRPNEMIMDVTKFEKVFDMTLPKLKDEISKEAEYFLRNKNEF